MKDLLNTLIGNAIAPSGSGGQGGTKDHNELTNRDAEDQHPISAITGLQNSLDSKASKIDYSTEEQDTGVKWIDGKTIYEKSYSVSFYATDSITIEQGFITNHNVDNIIETKGSVKYNTTFGTTIFQTISFYADNNNRAWPRIIDGGELNQAFFGNDFVDGVVNMTVLYTKTT